MIAAFWKKVLADLWGNKSRSLLVALSIAVGIFAVGVVVSSFTLVKQDMAADYATVNPHTAQIFCEDFDQSLVTELANTSGVDSVEGRYNLWVKAAASNGKQYPINIQSIRPMTEIKVDQLVFEQGSKSLGDNQIYLERQGAAGLGLKPGNSVDLFLKDGQVLSLTIAGTVHDVFANPFKFNSQTSGYVTPSTMEALGGSSEFNFVTLVTSGSHTDAAHVREVAERVAVQIKQSGREVYTVSVNNPGKHPAQSIIDTVLSLMGALRVLAVFLSAFLVTNTISALMGQQIRQIGVMKAVGATFGQLAGMYLVLVLAFGLLALLIAVPLGGLAALGLSRWLVGMLNANPGPFSIPLASLGLQILIGLAVPLVGALVPVIGGARLTVRQAISNYGLSTPGKYSLFDRLLEAVRGLPRPLMLSLRNTFQRKGRLALTLSTLVLGGAIFIGVFSTRESIYSELAHMYGYYQSDINVEVPSSTPVDQLHEAAQSVSGVVSIEDWWSGKLNVARPDGLTSDQVLVFAPPANTKLVTPVMTEGRWLMPSDRNVIVVDNHFVSARPDVKVGDSVQVRVDKKDYSFQVVGIYKMAGNSTVPMAYMNNEALTEIRGGAAQASSLRIVTDRYDAARQDEVARGLQASYKEMGIDVSLQTGSEISRQQHAQLDLLIYLLLFMAVLIAAVGGLGLMGTMGMNVLERTREIGVMRSIGAENGVIFQLVVVEGLLIGLISWALSIAAAIPMAHLLDARLGSSLMSVPLVYEFSTQGVLAWLGVVLVLSTIASLLPARNAVRLAVRDVLAYE